MCQCNSLLTVLARRWIAEPISHHSVWYSVNYCWNCCYCNQMRTTPSFKPAIFATTNARIASSLQSEASQQNKCPSKRIRSDIYAQLELQIIENASHPRTANCLFRHITTLYWTKLACWTIMRKPYSNCKQKMTVRVRIITPERNTLGMYEYGIMHTALFKKLPMHRQNLTIPNARQHRHILNSTCFNLNYPNRPSAVSRKGTSTSSTERCYMPV